MTVLFASALLLSAALIFIVEPMVAKMLLPLLGGSPSVWNTCLVFFQAGLLVGYVYAHLLSRVRRPAVQAAVHLAILAATLPLLPPLLPAAARPPVEGTPIP